jgi:rhamnose utilization protein RhaD (predicted bifunctional aldolase and dehydrogenase)
VVANTSLDELVDLSRRLGDRANDYAILGEGNTSALEDDGTFWVKASGTQLASITRAGFVAVSLQRALDMVDDPSMNDERVAEALVRSKADPAPGPLPSVETPVHAVCLDTPGVRFVGHTHPTPVNAITCSTRFRELLSGRLFPDEVVVCGPEPVLVEYVDPGVRLAARVRHELQAYVARHHAAPRTVYLQNHGIIALGRTARDVENIMAMAVKSARILLGTLAGGGQPNFLPASQVERIRTRADEHYRQRIIAQGAPT